MAQQLTGLVFDIEEFAVYDGPGIRTVVFLKGCPLRCQWCHNPEGLSLRPQRVKTLSLCKQCGRCDQVCSHPETCTACGRCAASCPAGCLRIAGTPMTPKEVADKIRPNAELLTLNGGGVTFSGGEALSQADFVLAVRALLPDVHTCIETSGFAPLETYQRVTRQMDLVIQDVKLMDPQAHRHYTGVDNTLILQNVRWLRESGIPFRIRVPVIPGVNDSRENMRATAELLRGAKALQKVELLRYNKAAGAKYAGVGMTYSPEFDPMREVKLYTEPFKEVGIPCDIL